MPEIRTYFEEREWTLQDYINNSWTKDTSYERFHLGKEKNLYGECINCKGVIIQAEYGNVIIATFNILGLATRP